MSVNIAPDARRQFINASGVPYAGALLFYYTAGTSTKETTYTDSTGVEANSNPIILDSAGRTPYAVWFTNGVSYKEILAPSTDSDPPTSPIWTEDYLSGVNDKVGATGVEWIASGMTPTYTGTQTFTVTGDQVSTLDVGRRLQFSVSAGTVYGRISTSVYAAVTTVTMVMDAGQTLDAGLSLFNLSILTGTNHAVPKLTDAEWVDLGLVAAAGANTISGNNTVSGNNTFSGISTFSGTISGATPFVFEGSSVDAFETSLAITNPTADRTITVPDADVDLTKIRQATTLLDGIVTRSTSVQNAAGTEDSTYVTPLGVKQVLSAGSAAPVYACRLWCNFNGTGTIAVRESGNVSSLTDNGTGDYSVNFTTELADADYAVNCNFGAATEAPSSTENNTVAIIFPTSASSCRITTVAGWDVYYDMTYVYVAIHR